MSLAELIKTRLGDRIPVTDFSISESGDRATVTVENQHLHRLMEILRTDDELKFDFLQDVCGLDYLGKGTQERYMVAYHLFSYTTKKSIRVKTYVNEEKMEVESVADIWPSANWAERETFDMYGIKFKNHPNMKRILLPDEFPSHPLRKDYPLQGKGERMNFTRVE